MAGPAGSNDGARADVILSALRQELRELGESPDAGSLEQATVGIRHPLEEMEQRWKLTPRPFRSTLPVIGPLVAGFRTLWNQVSTRWYVQPLIEQQMEFNSAVLRLAQVTVNVLDAMDGRSRWAEPAADDRTKVALAHSLAQMQVVLRRIEAELAVLKDRRWEDALADIRGRLTRLEAAEHSLRARSLPPPGENQTTGGPSQATLPMPIIDYVRFEARFRGTPEELKERQRPYVEYFPQGPVADLGCGRGEFLELLREAGIAAKGVDGEPGMIAACRERGLDVEQGDLLEFLVGQQDGSLAGVFTAQVVEHLPPASIMGLLHLAHQKLKPGGTFLAETINPQSLLALSNNYTLDLSHRQPVHPETFTFLAESAGFSPVEVRYSSPVPEGARLQPVISDGEIARGLNDNVKRLNDLLYGYQDYALIARKPA